MKYAKKFKLVPYSTETPGVSQVATTFNNALTSNTFPDEKVKIYNQALSKIKELNPTDTNDNKYDAYEENNEDPNEKDEDRKKRIAKEIEELEKITSEQTASKTVKDYSNSDFLRTKKFKEKSKFDNEKFMNLLKEISDDLYAFKRMTTMNQEIQKRKEKSEEMLEKSKFKTDTAIQTNNIYPITRSIQTDNPIKMDNSIQTDTLKKNNQSTATDYDYNMQELNEDDGEFIHRRLKDYLIRNPDVNESLSLGLSPQPKPSYKPDLRKPIYTDSATSATPKVPTFLKTSKIVNSESPPKRSRLNDITPLDPVIPVTIPFFGLTNEDINEDNNDNFTDLDLTQPMTIPNTSRIKRTKKNIKNRVKEENRKLIREKKENREKRRQEEKEEKAKQEEEEKAAKEAAAEKAAEEAAEKLRIEEVEKAKKPKRRNNPHPTSNIIPTTRRNNSNNNSTNKNRNFAF